MNSIPVVELYDVSKIYRMPAGDVHALNHIDFSIQKGEFVAIMGPSGSRKSTLMNMVGCLDVPTSGEIKINGKSTSEMTDDELTLHRRETIGFIFQKYNLISLLIAYENVEYPLILKHGHKDTTTRTTDLLRMVGLDRRSDAAHTLRTLRRSAAESVDRTCSCIRSDISAVR